MHVTADDRSPVDYSVIQQLVRLVIRLAALLHDIGKANDEFQNMLRGTAGPGQHLRHELVSYLMLRELANKPQGVLERLAEDAATMLAQLSSPLEVPGTALQPSAAAVDFAHSTAIEALQNIERGPDPLFGAVLYLVLTHHRQIGVDQGICGKNRPHHEWTPSLLRHLNSSIAASPSNLKVSSKTVPWSDPSWLLSVQQCAKSIQRCLADHPGLLTRIQSSAGLWAKSIAVIARPTLIQADHLASASKTAHSAADAGTAFANTTLDGQSRSVLADTLSLHLLKTKRAVDPYFAGMEGIGARLPTWQPPTDSIVNIRDLTPTRFAWQSEAAAAIDAVPNIATRPFFAMVISSTGAGKALGGPKVLAAACAGELRYTCALGLRSLTLQTGASYRTQLGTPPGKLLTVVGDALYAKLSGVDADAATLNETQGSESLDLDDAFVFDADEVPEPGEQLCRALNFSPEQAAALAQGKAQLMTEVPVLVCTVDHIMGAAALDGGSDTRMSLRLASADLILDEIDNYSLEDLQALGRLVHQAGCHGRRVVLMSATVSETVLKTLYKAWKNGLAVWQFRTGGTQVPVLALVSNQTTSRVLEDSDESTTSAKLSEFVEEICTTLTNSTPRTKAEWMPLAESLDATYTGMFEKAISLSRMHHTRDDASGKTVSIGFVRFNQVKHCRQFAKFAFDEATVPEGTALKVQCYHRRMPLMHLTFVESHLNRLLNRKDSHAVFKDPLVTQFIAEQPVAQHYIILVSTTSIQETGRDHDYDFAITEPWSTRSLVQLAGRVLRHRHELRPVSANIAVLEAELTYAQGKGARTLELGRELLFSAAGQAVSGGFGACTHLRPGTSQSAIVAATVWKGLTKQRKQAIAPPSLDGTLTRKNWLSPQFFGTGIDARPCLSEAHASYGHLSFLEQLAQQRRMGASGGKGLLGLLDVAESAPRPGHPTELLWNRHNKAIQFRRQTADQAQITLDPLQNFNRLVSIDRNSTSRAIELKARPLCPSDWRGGTSIQNTGRALLALHQLTPEEALHRLGNPSRDTLVAKLSHSFEVPLRRNSAGVQVESGATVEIDYDPLLGADRA